MSGTIRFFSDPHFGHNNMAVLRGFKDFYHQDEHIICKWNETVKKKDTTWILGDITMEKANYDILNRLNGYKRVVLGNHDQGNHTKILLNYVNSIHGLTKIRFKKYGSVFLSHSPIHPQELDYRVSFNIHGHVHENSIKDKRYINVCAEVINYTPKTIEELMGKNVK